MTTMQRLAKDAIMVQDACNSRGISKAYTKALDDLYEELVIQGLFSDTRAICYHPINQLWASKLHDLAGMGLSNSEAYEQAYRKCKIIAGE